jgi:ABC-type sugar transport system ATPase subunit
MALADRILVMNLGEIMQVGTPDEIYNKPRNMFVADFIGEPPFNFLNVNLAARNGGWALVTEDQSCEVAVPADMRAKIGEREDDRLVLGFRPMFATPSLEPKPTCNLKGKVWVFENLGEKGMLTMEIAGSLVRIVTAPGFGGEIGDPAWLELDVNNMHAFDPTTQLNLTL